MTATVSFALGVEIIIVMILVWLGWLWITRAHNHRVRRNQAEEIGNRRLREEI